MEIDDQKIHHVIRSEADLFTVPPIDTTVEKTFFAEYKPTVNIRDCDAKLEFRIVGNSNQYLDFAESFFYCVVKVYQEDGKNLPKDVNVGTTNLFMHSLFSQCEVYVSNELVSTSNNCYAYKAYLETLLSHGRDCLDTQGMCTLFFPDTDGGLITNNIGGLVKRKNAIKESKHVELAGRLKFDLAHQNRYILNDTDVIISLTRNKDEFALKTWIDTKDPQIKPTVQFLDASLFVRKHELYPSIIVEHQKLLQTQNAIYPIKKSGVKFCMIPAGNSTFIEENLFNTRKLPNRIVVGLVKSKAFNGDFENNPFRFEDFDMSYLSLSVNGYPMPIKPLTIDFSNSKSLLPYYLLFSGLQISNEDHGLALNYDDFKNGSTLFVFDLQGPCSEDAPATPQKDGSIKLEINFSKALKEALHCVVYSEEVCMLQLDKFRKITA